MALVPRFTRRQLGARVLDALDEGRSHDRFTRTMIVGRSDAERETDFFFMTLTVPASELDRGYEQYRDTRRRMLEAYALAMLRRYPSLKRIIGIATEPRPEPNSQRGSSEDLIMAGQVTWTPELLKALEEREQLFNIAREGTFREYAVGGDEFPTAKAAGAAKKNSPIAVAVRRALDSGRPRN